MSVKTLVYLYCDGHTPACRYRDSPYRLVADPAETASALRRQARIADGWIRHGSGADLCADCTAFWRAQRREKQLRNLRR